MKTLRFFKFVEGRLEPVDSFSISDPETSGYSYLIVVIVDGIPVRSVIV